MGLIAETVYTRAEDIINPTYVVHVPASRVCTDGSSSSAYEDTGSFDITIYRVLSMQDDMKTLVEPIRARNEFDLFIKYAEAKTTGTLSDANFDSLDAYLGTIGISQEMCEE